MTTADEPLNLGLLLFIPYRFMESAVLDVLRTHGHDLARVFQRINPQGSRLSELAQAAQLSKQTVGSIVDQLEAAGYVHRVPDPRDARARLVTVTAKGLSLVELSTPVLREIETAWTTALGRDRMRQLKETLTELRAIADPYA
jgi:DNA-binding MarR family transcriptional regulator